MPILPAMLDLGEIGEQIDAIVARDSDLDDFDASEVDTVGTAPVAAAGEEAPPSTEPEVPAAAAGDDFEARYQERSKKDFGELRSGLDRQITTWRTKAEDLEDRADEAEAAVGWVLQQLREYDPEAADNFLKQREPVRKTVGDSRKLQRISQREVEQSREDWYASALDGQLDPQDPDLLAAFRKGDKVLERALIDARTARMGLVFDRDLGRFVKPAPLSADQKVAGAPATAEPKAEAPRNAAGQFVKASVVAETRRREEERGVQPRLGGTAIAEKPAKTLQEANAIFQRGMRALGSS